MAGTNTIGYAIAQYGNIYAYADNNNNQDYKMIPSVPAGSTVYLYAMVASNGSGWSYARVHFL